MDNWDGNQGIRKMTNNMDLNYEEAESIIAKMWESFEKGDLDQFSQTMSQENDMVSFGTDASERWDGWKNLEESVRLQFESYKVVSVKRKDKTLKLSNTNRTAWFSEIVDWEMAGEDGNDIIEGIRYTGVMEKIAENWKIVQFHCSVGVEGQVLEY